MKSYFPYIFSVTDVSCCINTVNIQNTSLEKTMSVNSDLENVAFLERVKNDKK